MYVILLLAVAASVWGGLPALISWQTPPGFLMAVAWSLLGALLLGGGLVGFSFDSYRHDSLWTLAPRDQAVVAGLAASLMLLGGWAAVRVARKMAISFCSLWGRAIALSGNLFVTLVCYVALWFVSPQIFYTYYRLIFADLPQQWVIGTSAQLDRFTGAIFLGDGGSLAAAATGLYFWLLISLTISVHVIAWRIARR